ncbi:MAG: hypothetical protein GY856_44710 [bacterium]|nr:hypothetical protein [bacterium]
MVRLITSGALVVALSLAIPLSAATRQEVQARVTEDLQQERAIVVHIVVALCDNLHQGIVPVTKQLGDGQNPNTNLYWGAAYGVRTYLARSREYRLVDSSTSPQSGLLERVIFHASLPRAGQPVDVFVVADAWDGREIRQALQRFLSYAAGHSPETIRIESAGPTRSLSAGGSAALIGYVGHNGLMDFTLSGTPKPASSAPPRSSLVLACASKPYFLGILRGGGSHPLLLTTGLMAPEAYSLEAAIASFVAGVDSSALRESVAAAYHKFQKCGLQGALRLFSTEP